MPTLNKNARHSGFFLCLLAALLCGGSCGAFGTPTRLDAAFDRTGTLQSNGAFIPITTSNHVAIGDEGNTNLAVNGFISISLSAIPAGASISQVSLKLHNHANFGNPFGDFVTMFVTHLDVVSGINIDDFSGSGELVTSFTQQTFGTPPADVEIDITDQVKADFAAGKPISSFRFSFGGTPTKDSQYDSVLILSVPDDPESQPFAIATLAP